MNETAEMDLYRASLVSLQSDIAAANSQAKTNVKVGVVMLDSEVKFFRPLSSRPSISGWLASSDPLACRRATEVQLGYILAAGADRRHHSQERARLQHHPRRLRRHRR